VRLVTILQGELGSEVFFEEGCLVHLGQNGTVDLLLECLAGLVDGGLLILLGAEELLVILLVGGLWLLEEIVVDLGRHLDSRDIYYGLCRNDIGLRDTTEWHTIDLVWARDEQEARFQLLEEHNTGALEVASQEDQHSARGD